MGNLPEGGLAISTLLRTGGGGSVTSGTLEGSTGVVGLASHGGVSLRGSTTGGGGVLVGESVEVLERHGACKRSNLSESRRNDMRRPEKLRGVVKERP